LYRGNDRGPETEVGQAADPVFDPLETTDTSRHLADIVAKHGRSNVRLLG
jgi:hypothetical protein